jgi:hypothetical protein
MPDHYHHLLFTPNVQAAQERAYGRRQLTPDETHPERLGSDEMDFIARRDSFYMSTISENCWPYVQHRGGAAGFLHVIDDHTLAFADLRGNRQLLSAGNLAQQERVALFLMDYPRRERLKILGHARIVELKEDPALSARLLTEIATAKIAERFFVIDVIAFDWNCPKYITPRYTVPEIEAATQPLRDRIAELEKALAEKKQSELFPE